VEPGLGVLRVCWVARPLVPVCSTGFFRVGRAGSAGRAGAVAAGFMAVVKRPVKALSQGQNSWSRTENSTWPPRLEARNTPGTRHTRCFNNRRLPMPYFSSVLRLPCIPPKPGAGGRLPFPASPYGHTKHRHDQVVTARAQGLLSSAEFDEIRAAIVRQ
jgi:hypothetical protein